MFVVPPSSGHSLRNHVLIFHFTHFFLGPHWCHLEVPSLGVRWELQLPVSTSAMAPLDPSSTCDLCSSLGPCRSPNPLTEARDRTRILTETTLGS